MFREKVAEMMKRYGTRVSLSVKASYVTGMKFVDEEEEEEGD